MTIRSLLALAAAASLAACSGMGMNKPMMFSQASLPDSRQGADRAQGRDGNRRRRRHHLRMPRQGQRPRPARMGLRRPRCQADGPRRQAGRQVLRPAGHLGEHGRLQAHRHAGRRGAQRHRQHSLPAREGQPGDGQRRDAGRELHPARRHAGRRGAGDGLRRVVAWARSRWSSTRPTTSSTARCRPAATTRNIYWALPCWSVHARANKPCASPVLASPEHLLRLSLPAPAARLRGVLALCSLLFTWCSSCRRRWCCC